ncbi:MAG: hypothetical protein ACP6IY_18790 [Promethearchaeia archaeon]
MGSLASAPAKYYRIDGKKVLLRDPTDFLIEGLSLPKEQGLPSNYFEFGEIIVAGCMGSGKSVVVEHELAVIARDLWSEKDENGNIIKSYIDFFKAEDISGTIEALMKSNKYVKFVFFDDAIGKGKDSRQSMTRENIQSTQKYLIIRHLVAKGLLKAGYVILVLATQDLSAIDKRIRSHAGVVILKSYVEGCEKFLEGNENKEKIIKRLKYLSYNAAWRHRRDIRKIGIAIDNMGNCYEIITDTIHERIEKGEQIEPIKWIMVEDGTTLKKHFNELSDYALSKLIEYEGELSISELKGALLPKLAEMEKKYNFCEVSEAYFTPAIWQARWRYRKMQKEIEEKAIEQLKTLNKLKQKQINELETFVVELLKEYGEITNRALRGALNKKLIELKQKYNPCLIHQKDFTLIIDQAKFTLMKLKKQTNTGWTDEQIVILHDAMGLSFRQIEEKTGIPHSTLHKRYERTKKRFQARLLELKNNEIEKEAKIKC